VRENLIWFRKVSVYWETDRESLTFWKKRNILARAVHPKYSANAALRWNTIWRNETSRTVGFLARGWKHQETGPFYIPANYGDRIIYSNSTWKLSYAITSILPGRATPRPMSYVSLCGLSRFLPRDRRLCSLQLIAVRPNGSSIRVNTVAIMLRPRSLLPKREARRNVCPRHTLCAYMCSLSSYELISHNRSRLVHPFPLLSPS